MVTRLDNKLVEIERYATSAVAHTFDGTTQTWRAARLSGATEGVDVESYEIATTPSDSPRPCSGSEPRLGL
jgi:hypothetical protein